MTTETATERAWRLIDRCPWVINTPEAMIVLRLARRHDRGIRWVGADTLAADYNHSGGSLSNTRELLTRPRLNDDRHPFFVTTKGDNDVTLYQLAEVKS